MVSPKVCDAQLRRARPKRDLRICHAKLGILAIRLLRGATFQKKIASTLNKTATNKRPQAGAFDIPYRPRSRQIVQIVTKGLALRYSCRSLTSVGSIAPTGAEK
jgi:hypothetical protein